MLHLPLPGLDDSVVRLKGIYCLVYLVLILEAQGDLSSWLQQAFTITLVLPLQPRKLYSPQEGESPSHTSRV